MEELGYQPDCLARQGAFRIGSSDRFDVFCELPFRMNPTASDLEVIPFPEYTGPDYTLNPAWRKP